MSFDDETNDAGDAGANVIAIRDGLQVPEAMRRELPAAPRHTIEPLGDHVIFKRLEPGRMPNGLYAPQNIEERTRLLVVAVGPGRLFDDGTRHTPQVKPGDLIMLSPHGLKPWGFEGPDGEDLWVCRDTDIVARRVPAPPDA